MASARCKSRTYDTYTTALSRAPNNCFFGVGTTLLKCTGHPTVYLGVEFHVVDGPALSMHPRHPAKE